MSRSESHGPRLSSSEETTNEKESNGTRAKKCQRGVSEHYRPSTNTTRLKVSKICQRFRVGRCTDCISIVQKRLAVEIYAEKINQTHKPKYLVY